MNPDCTPVDGVCSSHTPNNLSCSVYNPPGKTQERLVVRGRTRDGEVCNLETVREGEAPAERIAYWSSDHAAPYNNDVHVACETTTVTYTRISLTD